MFCCGCRCYDHDRGAFVDVSPRLGGDSETQACVAGAIAEACFDPAPSRVREQVQERLPDELQHVADCFEAQFRFRREVGPARTAVAPADHRVAAGSVTHC